MYSLLLVTLVRSDDRLLGGLTFGAITESLTDNLSSTFNGCLWNGVDVHSSLSNILSPGILVETLFKIFLQ